MVNLIILISYIYYPALYHIKVTKAIEIKQIKIFKPDNIFRQAEKFRNSVIKFQLDAFRYQPAGVSLKAHQGSMPV